jgi:aquaporin Z
MDARKLLAELIGTFVFFLIGFMSILATNAVSSTIDLVVIAFGFGLGLFAAIQIGGAVSGGHFNPAVTIGALLDKRIDPMNAVGYLIAQLIGGLGAAAIVLLVSSQAVVAGTRTTPGTGISDLQALVLEIVFTAIFVAVILTVTKLNPDRAFIVIPLTLVAIHVALIPITGASVNPARSIAPAIIGGDLTSLWIYIVGPIVGSVGGWAVYRALLDEPAQA